MKDEKSPEEIMEYCKKLYGNCTDGSFQACLHFEGYYREKKKSELLVKVMNEFTAKDLISVHQ